MKATLFSRIVCVFFVLLGACSTGGGKADFDLRAVPGTRVFESEKDFDTTTIGGRYRLSNNTWNRGASSGRHRQKIFVNDDNGAPIFGWVWKWRSSSGVATYPEVLVGDSPFSGPAGEGSGLPFQIGSKRLRMSYNVALETSGVYNIAFEF